MSDEELIARLREDVFYGDERLHNLSRHNPLHMEAADRIEALVKADRAQVEVAEKQAETIIRINARAERLEAAMRELVTCVEDGCFCSEMKMATAIEEAHAALKGYDQ